MRPSKDDIVLALREWIAAKKVLLDAPREADLDPITNRLALAELHLWQIMRDYDDPLV